MDPREVREERVGLGGAAAILGRSASTVRRYVAEGRLHAERTTRGGYSLRLAEVEELALVLNADAASANAFRDDGDEEEVFEGEVVEEDAFGEGPSGEAPSREASFRESSSFGDGSREGSGLPAVPFERYERLLQQGQDYKTRLEERSYQIEEVRKERDAARTEIDRLWSEIERLNLLEFQKELQERTISSLEEEKARLTEERDRLSEERMKLVDEKASIVEERIKLEAELNALKGRGFWARLFGG